MEKTNQTNRDFINAEGRARDARLENSVRRFNDRKAGVGCEHGCADENTHQQILGINSRRVKGLDY